MRKTVKRSVVSLVLETGFFSLFYAAFNFFSFFTLLLALSLFLDAIAGYGMTMRMLVADSTTYVLWYLILYVPTFIAELAEEFNLRNVLRSCGGRWSSKRAG